MIALPCIVSAQIDAYQAQVDRDEGRSLAIEATENELQQDGNECDPLDPNNFGEAMAGADFTEVVALYREGDDLAAGFALRRIAEKHCRELAESIAEDRLDEDIERSKEDAAADAYEDQQYEASH